MVATQEQLQRIPERSPERESSKHISADTARFLITSHDSTLSEPNRTINAADKASLIEEISKLKTEQLPSGFVAQLSWENRKACDDAREGDIKKKYEDWSTGLKTWFDGSENENKKEIQATFTANGIHLGDTIEQDQINTFFDTYLAGDDNEASDVYQKRYAMFVKNSLAEFEHEGVIDRTALNKRLQALTPFLQRTFGELDVVKVIQADMDARSIISQPEEAKRELAEKAVTALETPVTDPESKKGFAKLAAKLRSSLHLERTPDQQPPPETNVPPVEILPQRERQTPPAESVPPKAEREKRENKRSVEVSISQDMLLGFAKRYARLPGYSLKSFTEKIREDQHGKQQLIAEGAVIDYVGETSFMLALEDKERTAKEPLMQTTILPDALCKLLKKRQPIRHVDIQALTGEIKDAPTGKQFVVQGSAQSFGVGGDFTITLENEGKGLKVVEQNIDYRGIGKRKFVKNKAEKKIQDSLVKLNETIRTAINKQLPLGELDSLHIGDGILELKVKQSGQPDLPDGQDQPERSGQDLQVSIAQDTLFEIVKKKLRLPKVGSFKELSGGLKDTATGQKQFVIEGSVDGQFGEQSFALSLNNEEDEAQQPGLQLAIKPETLFDFVKKEVRLPNGEIEEIKGIIQDTNGRKQLVVHGSIAAPLGGVDFAITLENEGAGLKLTDQNINYQGTGNFARGTVDGYLADLNGTMRDLINGKLLYPVGQLESIHIGDDVLELKAKKTEKLAAAA